MVTTAPETGAKYMRYYQSSRPVFIFSCFVLFHIIIIIKIKKARIQKNPTPSITNTVTSLPVGFFFFFQLCSPYFFPRRHRIAFENCDARVCASRIRGVPISPQPSVHWALFVAARCPTSTTITINFRKRFACNTGPTHNIYFSLTLPSITSLPPFPHVSISV